MEFIVLIIQKRECSETVDSYSLSHYPPYMNEL